MDVLDQAVQHSAAGENFRVPVMTCDQVACDIEAALRRGESHKDYEKFLLAICQLADAAVRESGRHYSLRSGFDFIRSGARAAILRTAGDQLLSVDAFVMNDSDGAPHNVWIARFLNGSSYTIVSNGPLGSKRDCAVPAGASTFANEGYAPTEPPPVPVPETGCN